MSHETKEGKRSISSVHKFGAGTLDVGIAHLGWSCGGLAVVFRASLPSSASSVEGSQPVTRAAEFAAFAPTIPNTIAVRAAEEFPPSQKSGSMNLDQVMEMLCSGATGGK